MLPWHAGPGRGWPLSAEEEAAFVGELKAAGGTGEVTRSDITFLMTALRSGATLTELMDFLPGTNPADMLACYRFLDRVRLDAVKAWWRICGEPGAYVFSQNAERAAVLLPVPILHLSSAVATAHGPQATAHLVMAAAAKVTEVGESASVLERGLDLKSRSDQDKLALGADLFNPVQPGVWGHPYFLATRVGNLCPIRIADILGERNPVTT